MGVILDNLPYMLRGLQLTLVLSVVSLAGSFVGGIFLALLWLSPWRLVRWTVGVYIDLMRMIPLIMVIFWFFFLIPILTGHPMPPIVAALWAMVAFNASYMAEIIRAGILSVPSGLSEAARASGLNDRQCMTKIVLPIAFKYMLPAIVSRFINIIMGTSLGYTIGLAEFFRVANDVNVRVFRPYTIYCFIALIYFISCYGVSLIGQWLARRFSYGAQPNATQ